LDALSYKTVFVNKEAAEKGWVIVDAENQIVGRIASNIAKVIRGKNKPSFTPNADCGDNVIVINAGKVRFTGKKFNEKIYLTHTGYTGGQREATPRETMAKNPTRVLEHAIKHMLPKTRLGRKLFNNVYIYAGSEHPHDAQQPKEIKF